MVFASQKSFGESPLATAKFYQPKLIFWRLQRRAWPPCAASLSRQWRWRARRNGDGCAARRGAKLSPRAFRPQAREELRQSISNGSARELGTRTKLKFLTLDNFFSKTFIDCRKLEHLS